MRPFQLREESERVSREAPEGKEEDETKTEKGLTRFVAPLVLFYDFLLFFRGKVVLDVERAYE